MVFLPPFVSSTFGKSKILCCPARQQQRCRVHNFLRRIDYTSRYDYNPRSWCKRERYSAALRSYERVIRISAPPFVVRLAAQRNAVERRKPSWLLRVMLV